LTTVTQPERAVASLSAQIAAAGERIAPTWPLDELIAVNPYWGWRTWSAPDAAALLGVLAGTALTMPRSWFRAEWAAGRLSEQQLEAAAVAFGQPALAGEALATLRLPDEPPQPTLPRMALVTDVLGQISEPRPGESWGDQVIHQIGQYCAAHYDRWQGSWHPDQDADLFSGWRAQVVASHGTPWRRGSSWARGRIASLPDRPEAAIEAALDALRIPEAGREAYLTALLLSVNGWASWCAYARWQARLDGRDDHEIVGLLAIRIAWEWLLRDDADPAAGGQQWDEWAGSWTLAGDLADRIAQEQRLDWLLQEAVERTYQETLIPAFAGVGNAPEPLPAAQAAFCIDVRSEVFRRALEAVAPDVRTKGFAGFFGLPISYTSAGSTLARPQLPGLLAPSLPVTDRAASDANLEAITAQLLAARESRRRWSGFRTSPSSMFSFVESMGLLYGPKLVKDSLARTDAPSKPQYDGLPAGSSAELRPRLACADGNPAAAAGLVGAVLHAMGLTAGFAPLVLLCGHGSQTANNPQAGALDCGACGGQSGEVNARVLAGLLNSVDVRAHLAALGIDVPAATVFVAGLHNTTTDEVELFDVEAVPADRQAELSQLRHWLTEATDRARAERAAALDLAYLDRRPRQLERALRERANDWSNVMPEWGLAGNASFIVAPRRRTRALNLGGRSFLHDYDWRLDEDLSVLTLIMTAPMVVANWINMQYYASTVDNRRYGSGNKVLHNVVGGRIGVFEGNGGDLRTGLALQSLHDGSTLRHPPRRLSVFIEAPRAGIDSVIGDHAVVRDLVAGGWVHLLRIEPSSGAVERWTRDGWSAP
jgi:uncharacterized protein YbcC (UPF0753/DUF2309 family)